MFFVVNDGELPVKSDTKSLKVLYFLSKSLKLTDSKIYLWTFLGSLPGAPASLAVVKIDFIV